MPALVSGIKAPDFTLTTTHGDTFSLANALKRGPVVLAFFKVTCPVCQYAAPLYERAYQRLKGTNVSFVGISQHEEDETEQFMRQYGVTFPVLLDDPNGYKVSNAYGLTNVPTVFLVAQDGTIEMSSVGWSKAETEDLVHRLSHGKPTGNGAALFKPGEDVADFRAG
jgi:cytochrome c biogenesis protein CcmG/thiol:disulfide interchange protein DsbE